MSGSDTAASALVNHVIARVDRHWPDTRPILVQLTTRWPAYALPTDSPLRTTLLRVARIFGVGVEAKITGPSNIGNYLTGFGDLQISRERLPPLVPVCPALTDRAPFGAGHDPFELTDCVRCPPAGAYRHDRVVQRQW